MKRMQDSEFVLGDSLEVLKEYESDQVHLIVTSPPYFNQREEYASYEDVVSYILAMRSIFQECVRILKPGRIFACNIGQDRSIDLPAQISDMIRCLEPGMKYIDTICWDKKGEIGTRGVFLNQGKYYPNFRWEPIYIYQKPSKDYGAGVSVGDDFPEFEFGDMEYINSVLRTNLWGITPAKGSWHPAPYPQELATNLIKCYTKRGDIVLDPFGGSGTTAKAALSCDRKYLLVERDKEYYDRAIKEVNSQPMELLL